MKTFNVKYCVSGVIVEEQAIGDTLTEVMFGYEIDRSRGDWIIVVEGK